VHAYHYFGDNDTHMDEKCAPLIKKNGLFAIVVPGLKEEITGELPKEMALSWSKDDIKEMHTCQWWRDTLEKSKLSPSNPYLNWNASTKPGTVGSVAPATLTNTAKATNPPSKPEQVDI
jgi:hypothetical protein